MKVSAKWFSVVAASALLIACGGDSNVRDDGGAYGSGSGDATSTGALGDRGSISSGGFDGSGGVSGQALLDQRTIYFELDRSEVSGNYRDVVEAHARYLASNPDKRVVLEGHADERGSREYNIALGQRRADAVKRLMTYTGASASQIRTLSYGEEKPVAWSHDEQAWALNRRVEIVYE